jgi:hypothetical protein
VPALNAAFATVFEGLVDSANQRGAGPSVHQAGGGQLNIGGSTRSRPRREAEMSTVASAGERSPNSIAASRAVPWC